MKFPALTESVLRAVPAVLCSWLGTATTLSAQGIPEPPIVFYGQVTASPPAPDLSMITFTLTGNSEILTTPTPVQIVTVESQSYYIVQIPFETRTVAGGPALTPTPNTLALPAAETTYTVTAKVGTTAATLPTGKTTLIYSAQSQGLIDRIDLSLGGETYEQWSQRIFGSLVSKTDDADGDGRTNYEEYLAGTDPKNANSRLTVKTFTPLPGGGMSFTWDTITGKTYRIERSTSLTPSQWSVLQDNIEGDGTLKTFSDSAPASDPHQFYRIAVTPDD